MTIPIEELKKRAEKIADFTRTPKRVAQAKKRQVKGAQASIGLKRSEKHKEAVREGQARRRAREREEKAKKGLV
jgi:hypothetical protein